MTPRKATSKLAETLPVQDAVVIEKLDAEEDQSQSTKPKRTRAKKLEVDSAAVALDPKAKVPADNESALLEDVASATNPSNEEVEAAVKPSRKRVRKMMEAEQPADLNEIASASETEPSADNQAEHEPQAIETLEHKRGIFARLFSQREPVAEQADPFEPADYIEAPMPVEVPTGPLTSEELALSPNQLRKLLTAKRKELRELTINSENAENEMNSALVLSEEYAVALQDLVNEQDRINRSYLGQVKQRMHTEIDTAKADLATHKANIENLEILEEGTLLALRKQFHKSFATVSKHTLFWLVFVTLLTNIKSLPNLTFFKNIYDHNTSGPIIVAVAVLIIGITSLVRRYLKLAKLSRGAYFKFLIWVVAIAAFLYFLPAISPWIEAFISPVLRYHYAEIVSALVSIWLISLFIILARYYSSWSEFRRNVELQVHQLRGVIEGYVKTQQEIVRLNILHRQVMDWMEMIANAVYRPWQVNPDWGSKKEYSSHFETFPFALRVAQAQEGSNVNMAALENDIAKGLLVPGWREDAFEDLIENIALSMGLDPNKFNSELLDRDLPHQSNNSRSLIQRFFETQTTAKPALGDAVLTHVAKKRLLDLVSKTQSQIVNTARPRVEQILDDPLASLREDSLGIDQYDPSESWDDFLRESLGTDSIEQVPLGPLNFNLKGRMAGATSKLRTFIVAPKRFQDSLPPVADPHNVELVSIGDDKPRSVEILARIDISEQIPFDHLTVMSSPVEVSTSDEVEPTRTKTLEKL
jgi:hypothetical protein